MPGRQEITWLPWMRENDMKKIKRLLILALILISVAAVPVLASELEPIYEGRVTLDQLPENWNPMSDLDTAGKAMLKLTAESLYTVASTGEILPGQAAGLPLDVTAEYAGSYGIPKRAVRGYAFAIDIREGASWEDGKAVNAADWYFTVEKWLEAERFPLEIANYQAFLRGDTKPSQKIIALKDAGFASVQEAEAAGHRDFYVDITHFWGLDAGWLRITDSTRLQDEAIPSGAEEMYLTAEYIYRNYLSDEGSQKMFQSEFVGIPVEAGEKLAVTDVGLIAEGSRITLILPEPTTSGSVALALSGMIPLRPGTYDEAYGTPEHYTACGPYRIASADQKEIVLEPNPHWTGEAAEFKIVRIGKSG